MNSDTISTLIVNWSNAIGKIGNTEVIETTTK